MLAKLFRKLVDLSPKFSIGLWQLFYDYIAARFKKSANWRYMNYGYADVQSPGTADFNTLSENLYHHLFTKTELAGKTILEVGCGRGGGCELLLQHKPAAVTGLDFSEKVIEFCTQTYHQPQLSFVAGNAEALPFADASFDAIVNVESSHCYGNRENFFKEVARVLKPGGHFLYADFMGRVHYPKRPAQLISCGLHIVNEEEITPNVLKAMELSAPYKNSIIKSKVPAPFRKPVNDFVGVPGSNIYNNFKNGQNIYFAFHCRNGAVL